MVFDKPLVYAVRHKDKSVISLSRSGGVFTAISDYVLSKNGVVYGSVLNDKFDAIHSRAITETERDKMRGSKYIQSRIGDSFKLAKIDLDSGKIVLFTGTSCQIEGLRRFLGKKYHNLFCLDIVCHGVPSNVIWRDYILWLEQKKKSKVIDVDFRNKKDFGWRDHVETISFDNGKRVNSKIFTKLFYSNNALRPSCYECPFKKITHPGDITIADYWGIEKAAPEYDDNMGISLVLVNSERGRIIFEIIKEKVEWKATSIEDSMQQPLIAPFPKPNTREQFWKDYFTLSFSSVARKYAEYDLYHRFRLWAKTIKSKCKQFYN